jgi:hypothetical protein
MDKQTHFKPQEGSNEETRMTWGSEVFRVWKYRDETGRVKGEVQSLNEWRTDGKVFIKKWITFVMDNAGNKQRVREYFYSPDDAKAAAEAELAKRDKGVKVEP